MQEVLVEQNLCLVRTTIAGFSATINHVLAERWLSESSRLQSIIREYGSPDGRFLYTLREDLYSNPFCDALLNIPELDQLQLARFRVISNGRQISLHYAYNLGIVVADPTFGQFVDLEAANSNRPQDFINGIYVGTFDDAVRYYGVEYC